MTSYIGWKLRLWFQGYNRVDSIEEFIASAKKFDEFKVEIVCNRRSITYGCYPAASYEYILIIYGVSKSGKQFAFWEKLVGMREGARFGTIDDIVDDSIVRGKADIALALRAEQRFNECTAQLPQATVEVIIRPGENVDDADWTRLHRDAVYARVEIA